MIDKHEHLDEGTIHAWLDDALAPDESALVELAAESCTECAARVAEARGLIAASSRILSSLDAVPAGVMPGTNTNVDQLAALRARQRAASRRWWQDRRIAVAASIVFVAGVSSLVLRSTPNEVLAPTTQVVMDSAVPTLPAPAPLVPPPSASPAPTAVREAASDAKAQSAAGSDMAKSRVATTPPAETVSARKAISELPAPPVVANEARERRADVAPVGRVAGALDSVAAARRERDQTATTQRPLRQEGARQAFEQLRVDSTRRAVAASAPAATPVESRLARRMVTTGVGAAMAEAVAPGGTCYRLVGLTAPAVADTIRLLNETAPVLSDPSWFRTRLYGALRDTTLAWRSIDSATVEVRSRFGSDTTAVRFRTDGALEGLTPLRVRLAFAERVACPR